MNIIKPVLCFALGYFAYQYYQENHADYSPFIGHWQSNKKLSMKDIYKTGVTHEEKQAFDNMLGNVSYAISDSEWQSTINGKTHIARYTVLSKDENSCYNIRFGISTKRKYCIVDGNIHLPSKHGRHSYEEVFIPI